MILHRAGNRAGNKNDPRPAATGRGSSGKPSGSPAPGGLVVREAKPWYRKSNDAWYVEIAGRRVRLAKGKANRAEAVKQFPLLTAGTQRAKPSALTADEVCDLFLRHSEKEHAAATFEWHKR